MRAPRYETKLEKINELDLPFENEIIDTNEKAAYVAWSILKDFDREHIVVLYLDVQQQLIGYELIAQGTEFMAAYSAKTLLKGALLADATSIITAHNHILSTSTKPSKADIHSNHHIKQFTEAVDISILADIVVNHDGLFWLIESTLDDGTEIANVKNEKKYYWKKTKKLTANIWSTLKDECLITAFTLMITLLPLMLLGSKINPNIRIVLFIILFIIIQIITHVAYYVLSEYEKQKDEEHTLTEIIKNRNTRRP